MEKIRQLTDTHELRVGLAAGMAIAAVLVVVGSIVRVSPLRRRFPRLVGLAGLAVAAAIAVLFAVLEKVDKPGDGERGFRLGLVALAAGGLISSVRPRLWTGAVAAIPGAWLLVEPGLNEAKSHIRPMVALTIVVACPLVAAFERRSPVPGLGCALLAITAFGHYVTVPDTEKARVVVGVTAPVGLVGWPLRLVGLGQAGSYASVGALAWAATRGGSARAGSVAGACACFGILVAAPLAWETMRGRRPGRGPTSGPDPVLGSGTGDAAGTRGGGEPGGANGADGTVGTGWVAACRRHPAVTLVVLHGVVVAWCARVAGLSNHIVPATVLAAPALVLGAALSALLVPVNSAALPMNAAREAHAGHPQVGRTT